MKNNKRASPTIDLVSNEMTFDLLLNRWYEDIGTIYTTKMLEMVNYLRVVNSLRNNEKDFLVSCKFSSLGLDSCYFMLDLSFLQVKEIEGVCGNFFGHMYLVF